MAILGEIHPQTGLDKHAAGAVISKHLHHALIVCDAVQKQNPVPTYLQDPWNWELLYDQGFAESKVVFWGDVLSRLNPVARREAGGKAAYKEQVMDHRNGLRIARDEPSFASMLSFGEDNPSQVVAAYDTMRRRLVYKGHPNRRLPRGYEYVIAVLRGEIKPTR